MTFTFDTPEELLAAVRADAELIYGEPDEARANAARRGDSYCETCHEVYSDTPERPHECPMGVGGLTLSES